MDTSTRPAADEGLGPLMGDIASDMHLLVKQHVDMLKIEVRHEIRQAAQGVHWISLAYGFALLTAHLLAAMLVGLLVLLAPQIPWWLSCGAIGAVMLMVTLGFYYVGRRKIAALTRLTDHTVQAAKDNIQWLKNHT